MEEAVGAESVAHGVGEARQLDAVGAHNTHPPKLQILGEIEDGAAVRQGGESILSRQRRRTRRQGARDPGGRDTPANDALPRIGLEPIDPRRLVRQSLPDRQQQAGDDVDGAVGELRYVGKLGPPSDGEGIAVGLDPMALRHHFQRGMVLLHRPDEPHAPLDLAIVEHQRWRWHLHGGAARAVIDQQDGAAVGEMIERLVEHDGPIALALGDGQQPGLRPGAGMDIVLRSVTTKLSARSVSSPTS